MKTAMDALAAAIAGDPRDNEYIDVGDTSAWTAADKRAVASALIAMAEGGDTRAPAALPGLLPGDEVRATLERFVAGGVPPAVVAASAQQLLLCWQRVLDGALLGPIRDGVLDPPALRLAVTTLLDAGALGSVRELLRESTREDVRSMLIARLWAYHRFALYPSVWWSSLGLLEVELEPPFASFREPALRAFSALMDRGWIDPAEYPPVVAPAAIPADLIAALREIDTAKGPTDVGRLGPLDAERRRTLCAFAAKQIAVARSPRAAAYLAALSGETHADALASLRP